MKTLNDMKHTQGEWDIQTTLGVPKYVWGNQEVICSFNYDDPNEKEFYSKDATRIKANAKLIAAAPVMLNELITDIPMLEEAIEYIKSGKTSQAISHLGVIILSHDEAIKKATS